MEWCQTYWRPTDPSANLLRNNPIAKKWIVVYVLSKLSYNLLRCVTLGHQRTCTSRIHPPAYDFWPHSCLCQASQPMSERGLRGLTTASNARELFRHVLTPLSPCCNGWHGSPFPSLSNLLHFLASRNILDFFLGKSCFFFNSNSDETNPGFS